MAKPSVFDEFALSGLTLRNRAVRSAVLRAFLRAAW